MTRGQKIEQILQRLVELKDHKDNYGKDSHYLSQQPILWRKAREILRAKPVNELFPDKNPEKKTLFKNSTINSLDFVLQKFKKEDGFENVDLAHYFGTVSDWSNMKNMKRTSAGWVSTIRDFVRRDMKNGKCVFLSDNNERLTITENDHAVDEFIKDHM